MATVLGHPRHLPRPQPRRPRLCPLQTQVLRPRHVPLPERGGSARRPSRGLHRHRYSQPLQTHVRLQRPAPHGLGRLRSPGRAVCDQNRPASRRHHRAQRRHVPQPAQTHRLRLRLAARDQHHRPEILPVDPVHFPQTVPLLVQPNHPPGRTHRHLHRGEPGRRPPRLRGRGPRELVPGARNRPRQRRSHRWQERGGWPSRRKTPDAPVDAAHYRLRRPAHLGAGRARLAGIHQAAATQLDWPFRGG